ncbi:ABC transporter permease [Actinoplanes sp. NPDC051861]|uniref:ABC transporter permease n=1 Tax=Actinoplanes sp. NPDC051861 TaxID=3155170 RepID=UPI00342D829C
MTAHFRDLLVAEWMKWWSLRSTTWTLLLSALTILTVNCWSAYNDLTNFERFSADARADFTRYAMSDAFTPSSCLALMLAIGALGAGVVVGEYSTGLIRTTFVAVPSRAAVIAAKLLVLLAVTTGYGLIVGVGSFLATQTILDGKGAGLELSDPGVPEQVLATVLLAPLTALVAMAFGILVRHSIGTLTAFVLAFMLLPLALGEDLYATALLSHATPYRAWLRIADIQFGDQPYPWTPAGGWTVYAVWAAVSIALAVTVVRRRDH